MVTIQDKGFYNNDSEYYIKGFNSWIFPILALYDNFRLITELDYLKSIGINNIRLTCNNGLSEFTMGLKNPDYCYELETGKYNEKLFIGLDIFLDELRKRDMTAVLVLGNYWHWNGGIYKYMDSAEIDYNKPACDTYLMGFWDYIKSLGYLFYISQKAQKHYFNFIKQFLKRKNTINKIKYKDDSTIMAWQLCNEPRLTEPKFKDHYKQWIQDSCDLIRKYDKNHLVSLGEEGFITFEQIPELHQEILSMPCIDYICVHAWPYNWGWIAKIEHDEQLEITMKMYLLRLKMVSDCTNKPMVLEEFGFPRDNMEYKPNTPTKQRDKFLEFTFKLISENRNIAGYNYWTWGGYGIPNSDCLYEDDYLLGDPTYERQGLNSIYISDKSTLKIIGEFNDNHV